MQRFGLSGFAECMTQQGIDATDSSKVLSILEKCGVIELSVKSAPIRVSPKPVAHPEKQIHEGIAVVTQDGEYVVAIYDKNKVFIEIVKRVGFRWNTAKQEWRLVSGERTGTIDSICAEAGNRLLLAGFAVRFDTQSILEKAVKGDFAPICQRWITSDDEGFLYLRWERDAKEDLYQIAQTLPKARYDHENYAIKVPIEHADAVEDFAEKYGFKISKATQERIRNIVRYRVKESQASKIVVPERHENEDGILEDLLDEVED